MIKGILFDLDGTLLDREQSLVAFFERPSSDHLSIRDLREIKEMI